MKEKEYEVTKDFGELKVGDIVIVTGHEKFSTQYHSVKLYDQKPYYDDEGNLITYSSPSRGESYVIEWLHNDLKDKFLKEL